MEETTEELKARRDRVDRKKDEIIYQLMAKNNECDECHRKIAEQTNELIKIKAEHKLEKENLEAIIDQFKQDQQNCNVLSNERNNLMDQKEPRKNPEVTNSIPSSVR